MMLGYAVTIPLLQLVSPHSLPLLSTCLFQHNEKQAAKVEK